MENAALLVAIIQDAIDGIITIDNNGIIELINPAACALFDYQSNEVIGQNVTMLMPDSYKNQHSNYIFGHYLAGKENISGLGREGMGLRKDGTIFPFRLSLSEVQFAGRKIYTGFVHDLTKEKEAERKLKDYTAHLEELVEERTLSLKDVVSDLQQTKEDLSRSLDKEKELGQLKSHFVSLASHEFRTPLTSVKLSASLIEKYAEPLENPNITKHVSNIKNAVTNLTTILSDFLSIEKLEAGREEILFTYFDLIKFCEQVTEEMQVLAKQNQNIIYQHTGIKSMVNLDQNLLKICISNLITNAIKYSGENSFIDFNTEINGKNCIVTVKDNGIGIPDADQKHLFEAFFRAHNTGAIPGTGLGLNILTRYTSMMNGTVTFKSVVNEGTSFIISFPIL